MRKSVAVLLAVLACAAFLPRADAQVDYPVVYVRVPINAERGELLQDTRHAVQVEPGTDLIIRWPDGTEEVLFSPPDPNGGVLDPCVSLDGQSVYFAYARPVRGRSRGRDSMSDIFRVDITSREIVQLTHGEATPVGGDQPTIGIHNTGPCEVPGGRIIFTSSRNDFFQVGQWDHFATKYSEPALQLYTMDLDGKNVEQVGHLNLRGVLHPTLMANGEIMWSSLENHGMHGERWWGLWASKPDGRGWRPLFSAMGRGPNQLTVTHFQSQLPNGRVQLVFYYPGKASGFGNLLDFGTPVVFGHPDARLNPSIEDSRIENLTFPYQPIESNGQPGTRSLTPWATGRDVGDNILVTHPSGAPGGLLVSKGWVARNEGSRSNGTRRLRDAGVYFFSGEPAQTPEEMTLIVDSQDYHELQPRALVPWAEVYGSLAEAHDWVPNPSSTPFGWVGTSGVYARESRQLDEHTNVLEGPWNQGSDVGEFENSEIHAIRILAQYPSPRSAFPRRNGQQAGWIATGIERMSVLGEIPLRKTDSSGSPIMDASGDPDTSFLARIPADTSFTFQLIDAHGQTLTHSPTWHMVRPGEKRTDCRGCHAHHQPGLTFDLTEAAKADYGVADLTGDTEFVEYNRDIAPILRSRCSECHTGDDASGQFRIDDPSKSVRESRHVLPFRARLSEIMRRVLSDDADERMPLGHEPLTAEEIRTLALWIDIGAPQDGGSGLFFADHLRPTLHVESPRRNGPITEIRFGAFDLNSGISSISVRASFTVDGRRPGTELFDLFTEGEFVWGYRLAPSDVVSDGVVEINVRDEAGNNTRIERTVRPNGENLAGN